MRLNAQPQLPILIMLTLAFFSSVLSGCGNVGEDTITPPAVPGGGATLIPPTISGGDATATQPADPGGEGTGSAAEPAGPYVLGTARQGPDHLLDQYNKGITAETDSGEDRFSGYVLRVSLNDLIANDADTSGAIQWDFSPIINSLQTIQQETRGVRPAGTYGDPVTLQILTRNAPPPIVMAQIPDAEEYTRDGEQIPVPWSPAAVTVLQGLYTALANTTITDFSQPGNPTVLLKDHPTLVNINNTTLGHKGFRDNTNGPNFTHIWTIPGYDRDLYVANLLGTIKAIMTAFPNDFGFVEYFGFKDQKDSQFGARRWTSAWIGNWARCSTS